MECLSYFSQREIAGGLLLAGLLLYAIHKNREVLKSLLDVLKLIIFSKLTIWYVSSILTVVLTSLFLINIGFWEKCFIKDALVFSVTGFALMSKVHQTDSYRKYLKETVLTFFSVAYLFQFIFNYASFSIISEILLLVVGLLFYGMKIVAENPYYQKDFEGKDMTPVIKAIDTVFVFLGCVIVLKSLATILFDFHTFISIHNLKLLFLPIIYSVLYIPFSFIFWLVLKGESTYMRLSYLDNQSKSLNRYIKLKTFFLCGLDINKTNQWVDFLQIQETMPKTKEDIKKLIKDYKIKSIKLPFKNDIVAGINPIEALTLLSDFGLECQSYRYLQYSTSYGCYGASTFKRVGQVDTLEYYIFGNQEVVQEIYLKYCNNTLCFKENHIEGFIECADVLFNKVFNKKPPSKLNKTIRKGKFVKFYQDDYEVIVETERFNNNKIIDTKLKIRLIKPVEYSEFEIKNRFIT